MVGELNADGAVVRHNIATAFPLTLGSRLRLIITARFFGSLLAQAPGNAVFGRNISRQHTVLQQLHVEMQDAAHRDHLHVLADLQLATR